MEHDRYEHPVKREPRTREARLAMLDGYRALAVCMVMAFHYTVRWAAPADPADHFGAGGVFNPVVPLHYGWAGVELFFVISGFVVLMTMERCTGVADFVARRVARLWPPMLVCATLVTLLLNVSGPRDWRVSLPSYLGTICFFDPALLGHALHRNDLRWVDGAYWTLWTEVRFYALAALAFALGRRRCLMVWLTLQAAVALASFGLHGGSKAVLDQALFAQHMPYFTFGLCLYAVYARHAPVRLARAGLVGAASLIFANDLFNFHYEQGGPLGFLVVNVGIVMLSLGVLLRGGWLSAFAWPPVTALGRASYSLYLLHQLAGVVALTWLTRLGLPAPAAIAVVSAVMVGAALLLHRFVETPAKIWVHRRTRATVELIVRRAPWTRFPDLAPPPSQTPVPAQT